jgi:hypothetical protein
MSQLCAVRGGGGVCGQKPTVSEEGGVSERDLWSSHGPIFQADEGLYNRRQPCALTCTGCVRRLAGNSSKLSDRLHLQSYIVHPKY